MAIETIIGPTGKTVEVHVSGQLTKEDYERFVPAVNERVKEHGRIRILFDMHDFHGWSAGAMWEDFKFGVRHFTDIERLAIVGETKWQQSLAKFCRPFTTAKIKYFDHGCVAEARAWLQED